MGYFPEPADIVAGRIFDLHRRHGSAVCRVFDNAIKSQASALREGSLPADCLLSLVVGQRNGMNVYPAPSDLPKQISALSEDIRVGIDEDGGRVVFDWWGDVKGVSADLLLALAKPYREATGSELAPENYPFTKTADLLRQTNCPNKETLRRRVLRCRNTIMKMATRSGDPPPSIDAVIENSQWHGYRLNPDRVRIVALNELHKNK